MSGHTNEVLAAPLDLGLGVVRINDPPVKLAMELMVPEDVAVRVLGSVGSVEGH